MELAAIDYIYAVAIAIVGAMLIANPSTFMGRAKYDESRLKTESLLKKIGIGLIVFALAFAIAIFLR